MAIHSIYILSKSGGLIYQHDHNAPKVEIDRVFNHPLDIQLAEQNKRIVVVFGQKDGINVGNTLLAVNGVLLNGTILEDGRDANELLGNPENYPLTLRFGRPKLSTNEKIFLGKFYAESNPSHNYLSWLIMSTGKFDWAQAISLNLQTLFFYII